MRRGFITFGAAVASLIATVQSEAQPLPQLALRPVFAKLQCSNLVWMEEVPDQSGRFVIVGQDGCVLLAKKGTDGSNAKEFLNIENRHPHASTEQGFLSLTFHPGYKSNGLFCVCYSLQAPLRTIISEWKVSADDRDRADTNSERILLNIPQAADIHHAGLLSFGSDGFLYASIGDGGGLNDQYGAAQNTGSLCGKILRLDVNKRPVIQQHGTNVTLPYGIPPDNPFVSEADFYENPIRKEIWAYGFRNPWRYSWDRQTGDMWAGDVGQDKWEEIDLIVKGGNYGWGIREGAHHFKPGPPGAQYKEPIMEYPHTTNLLSQAMFPDHTIGACVIGGYVYRGAKCPSLSGIYIYGDYALGTIWGFRYVKNTIAEHGVLLQQPKNISSFAEDLDGELYVLMLDGHIYSIAPKE